MSERRVTARRAPARPGNVPVRPGSVPARAMNRPAARRAPVRNRGWLDVPGNRYALMKWILLAALVAYAVFVVGANSARDVDFGVIAGRMASAPGISALKAADENAFQDRLGISPEGCEGWLLYGSDEIMDVSEVMIAKGDESALDRLEEAARSRVEAQLNVFRSYGVNQKDLLERATLLRRGDYFFYAVGEYADQWEDIFLSSIR